MENRIVNQQGFLTLEIVFSLALISLFMIGALALVFSNQYMEVDAQNNASALEFAKTGMEGSLVQGFNVIAPADIIASGFTEHVQTTWLADYAKEISSSANYISSGRPGQTELNSLVTDTQSGLGRDTCALGFSGNWANPQLRGSINIAAGNPATDVDVVNGEIYITTNSAVQSASDFFVINAANVDHPSIIKEINTGPGLNAIHIAGDYAFAANSSINGQLQIIKITDPANPVVILNVKLPGVSGSGIGGSIFYSKGKVYIGTPKTTGPEFHVYDVSNPLAPVWLGAFETDTVVNKIYIFGNYAYIATADQNNFRVLDVSNPASIHEVGNFSGLGWASQSGQSLAMLGGRAIFGRAGGLPALGYPELYMLDVNNPSSVQNLNSADPNMSINDIFLRAGLAFMATNKTNGEFQIYNLANNQFNFLSGADLAADAIGVDCEGQNFFVAEAGNQILQVISAQ